MSCVEALVGCGACLVAGRMHVVCGGPCWVWGLLGCRTHACRVWRPSPQLAVVTSGTAERAPGHKQRGGGRAEEKEEREEEKEAKRDTRGEGLARKEQLRNALNSHSTFTLLHSFNAIAQESDGD